MTRLSILDFRSSIASITTTCVRIAFVAGAVICLAATPAFAATCESLAALALKDAKITSAQVVPSGQFSPPGGRGGGGANSPDKTLPEFCRVAATLTPSSDSDIRV